MSLSSEDQTVTVAESPIIASDVIRRFYVGLNNHDLATVEELINENCVYEDLVFPRPCIGHKAVLEFFKQFFDSTSTDLHFVIDDISGEDSFAVGVIWHLVMDETVWSLHSSLGRWPWYLSGV